jgi:hypothetical protein
MTGNSEATEGKTSRALAEGCLRLAYYVSKHGPIPEADQRRLLMVATFGRGTEEYLAIAALARDIRGYLLELPRSE